MSDRDEELDRVDELEPPPTEEELREAEALARALDGVSVDDSAAPSELFRTATRARASSGFAAPLAAELRDSIVDDAVKQGSRPKRRPVLRLLVGAVAAVFALFALGVIWLFVDEGSRSAAPTMSVEAHAALSGPTDELFDGPFPEDQTPAERADRIVHARTRGYFAAVIEERRERARATSTSTAAVLPSGGP